MLKRRKQQDGCLYLPQGCMQSLKERLVSCPETLQDADVGMNQLILLVILILYCSAPEREQWRTYKALKMNWTPEDRVSKWRYLGVHISEDLSWI